MRLIYFLLSLLIFIYLRNIYILNLRELGIVLRFVAGGGDNSGKEYRYDFDFGEFII